MFKTDRYLEQDSKSPESRSKVALYCYHTCYVLNRGLLESLVPIYTLDITDTPMRVGHLNTSERSTEYISTGSKGKELRRESDTMMVRLYEPDWLLAKDADLPIILLSRRRT